MTVSYVPLAALWPPASATRLVSSVVYQRGWRGSRRGSRGRAWLTVRARPATCVPLRASMARCAARLSGISTKPKPRERPVSRSVIILIVSTVPYGSKSWRRSCSVVVNAKLPPKIFTCGSPEDKGPPSREPPHRLTTPYRHGATAGDMAEAAEGSMPEGLPARKSCVQRASVGTTCPRRRGAFAPRANLSLLWVTRGIAFLHTLQ